MGAPQPAPPVSRPLAWIMLVAGVLLTAVGLGLVGAGALLAGADSSQREGRSAYTDPERFRAVGNALITAPFTVDPGEHEVNPAGAFGLEDLTGIRVRAAPVVPGQRVFLGIADADAVERYLAGVPHAVFDTGPWDDHDDGLVEISGQRVPGPPAEQRFWEHSTTGSTPQTLTVHPRPGRWVIVVMNGDGSRPVWVDVQAGANTDLFGLANPGALIAGLVCLALGCALILLGATGLGRGIDPGDAGTAGAAPGAVGAAPGASRGL